MSAPASLFEVNANGPSTVILAPSSWRARKCVSSLLLPITSPPGGGIMALPVRAMSGPAKRIDARIFLLSSPGISERSICFASIFQVWSAIFSTEAPRD